MRYVIFSRVSTNLQLDESQLFICREYVEKIKNPEDEIIEFNEPPTSTRLKMDERPVLMSLFEFLKRGDNLVVFCLTRLARTGSEIVKIYEDQITNKKVVLHSLGQPKVDKNFIHVYAMQGEMARDTISNNTKAGLRAKQAKMEKVGTSWFGYKTDPNRLQQREKVKSSGKPYLLIPDDTEQQAIGLMVKCHQEGYSYGEIVKALADREYKNREGKSFHKSTVWRVLERLKKLRQVPMAPSPELFHATR